MEETADHGARVPATIAAGPIGVALPSVVSVYDGVGGARPERVRRLATLLTGRMSGKMSSAEGGKVSIKQIA